MQVLVSDTSVLVDLERGNLLELAFGLSCAFAVPDLLYRRELRDQNGPALVAMGLRVEELGSEGGQARPDLQAQKTGPVVAGCVCARAGENRAVYAAHGRP